MNTEISEATATASETSSDTVVPNKAVSILDFQKARAAKRAEKPQVEPAKPEPEEEVLSQTHSDTEEVQEEAKADALELTEEERNDPAGKGKSRLLERVKDLSSEKKELKAELDALKKQVQELASQKQQDEVLKAKKKPEANPYKDLKSIEDIQTTAAQLDEVIEEFEAVIERANDNQLRGDDIAYEYNGQEFSKSFIMQKLREARKNRKEHLPARYAELQAIEGRKAQRKQLKDQAAKELEWLNDDESDVKRQFLGIMDGPVVKAILDKTPEAEPFIDYLVAHASNSIWGRKAVPLTEKKPVVEPNKTKAPSAALSQQPEGRAKRNLKELEDEVRKTGSLKDFERLRKQKHSVKL